MRQDDIAKLRGSSECNLLFNFTVSTSSCGDRGSNDSKSSGSASSSTGPSTSFPVSMSGSSISMSTAASWCEGDSNGSVGCGWETRRDESGRGRDLIGEESGEEAMFSDVGSTASSTIDPKSRCEEARRLFGGGRGVLDKKEFTNPGNLMVSFIFSLPLLGFRVSDCPPACCSCRFFVGDLGSE